MPNIFLNENYFKNKKNGTYIELGALDGVLYSNTKFFQDKLNWRGILIEPHPDKFILLQKKRPNNFLFNNLVSCHKEELKFRYFIDNHAAVSGVENTLSQHHFETYFESDNQWNKSLPQNTKLIKPITLTEIIKSTKISHIDFLSLDVEGHEYEVLKSWDFSIVIDLILIETLDVQPEKDQLCRDILIENGYIFIQNCKHNEIYIHNKCDYLLQNINNADEYTFFHGVDHIGDDFKFQQNSTADELKHICDNNEQIAGFNTLGFIKNKIDIENLKETDWINKNNSHGIYIKNKYL